MKTERTLRLLQEIKSQGPVSNWKEGPNLIEVDRVIKGCEKKLAKIHSMNMESSVIDYLETSEHKPFSLSSLEGILILAMSLILTSNKKRCSMQGDLLQFI